jgi:hypothetical protein
MESELQFKRYVTIYLTKPENYDCYIDGFEYFYMSPLGDAPKI